MMSFQLWWGYWKREMWFNKKVPIWTSSNNKNFKKKNNLLSTLFSLLFFLFIPIGGIQLLHWTLWILCQDKNKKQKTSWCTKSSYLVTICVFQVKINEDEITEKYLTFLKNVEINFYSRLKAEVFWLRLWYQI